MKQTNPRIMFARYPKLFMAMYLHSIEVDEAHPDDNSVIYSKLMANAQGANPPYWTPEEMDMEPIYEDFLENAGICKDCLIK